jgi:DNA-directed RNA polymerase subunit K/omega
MNNKFELQEPNKTIIKSYENKVSRNILTKYEKTTIIGVRIEQLAYGSPSTLSNEDKQLCKNITQIAEKELALGVIPFMICRNLPNRTEEYWKLKDLIVTH